MKSALPLLISLSIVIISLQFAITAQAAPSAEDYDVTATAFQKWLQLNRGASPLSLLMAANDDYDVVTIDDSDTDSEDDDVNGLQEQEYNKGSVGFEHHPRYSRYERQRVTNDVMKRAKSDWQQAWTTTVAKRVPKGMPNCMRICLAQRYLHPSQCHSLC